MKVQARRTAIGPCSSREQGAKEIIRQRIPLSKVRCRSRSTDGDVFKIMSTHFRYLIDISQVDKHRRLHDAFQVGEIKGTKRVPLGDKHKGMRSLCDFVRT